MFAARLGFVLREYASGAPRPHRPRHSSQIASGVSFATRASSRSWFRSSTALPFWHRTGESHSLRDHAELRIRNFHRNGTQRCPLLAAGFRRKFVGSAVPSVGAKTCGARPTAPSTGSNRLDLKSSDCASPHRHGEAQSEPCRSWSYHRSSPTVGRASRGVPSAPPSRLPSERRVRPVGWVPLGHSVAGFRRQIRRRVPG